MIDGKVLILNIADGVPQTDTAHVKDAWELALLHTAALSGTAGKREQYQSRMGEVGTSWKEWRTAEDNKKLWFWQRATGQR